MLAKLIDDYLLKQQEERSKKERSGMWSPSSFGRCYRYQFWNRKNEPQTNPPDIRSLRIFSCGHLFHDFVQGFLPEKQTEVEVNYEDIHGFADVVTADCVYDIKSIHSKGFFYLEKEDIKVGKRNNWLQVATYAIALNKPKICLCFVSKDDLLINEYVDHTEKWIEEVKKELLPLREAWQGNSLPPALPRSYGSKKFGDRECDKYCAYKNKCYEMEKYVKGK